MKRITEPEPVIHDWHSPRNEACPQNQDSARDCACTQPARQRARKPYRTLRVHDSDVPHNVRPDIIMEVHPNGRLIFREKGRPRRCSYSTTVGKIYSRMVLAEALAKASARARDRAKRMKERKAARRAARQ